MAANTAKKVSCASSMLLSMHDLEGRPCFDKAVKIGQGQKGLASTVPAVTACRLSLELCTFAFFSFFSGRGVPRALSQGMLSSMTGPREMTWAERVAYIGLLHWRNIGDVRRSHLCGLRTRPKGNEVPSYVTQAYALVLSAYNLMRRACGY
jgi:hypothetical protein